MLTKIHLNESFYKINYELHAPKPHHLLDANRENHLYVNKNIFKGNFYKIIHHSQHGTLQLRDIQSSPPCGRYRTSLLQVSYSLVVDTGLHYYK